jgi:hypothetical protein
VRTAIVEHPAAIPGCTGGLFAYAGYCSEGIRKSWSPVYSFCSRRIGQDLWNPFLDDLEANVTLLVKPIDVWKKL